MQTSGEQKKHEWMKWILVAVLLVLLAFLVPAPAMMESIACNGGAAAV